MFHTFPVNQTDFSQQCFASDSEFTTSMHYIAKQMYFDISVDRMFSFMSDNPERVAAVRVCRMATRGRSIDIECFHFVNIIN